MTSIDAEVLYPQLDVFLSDGRSPLLLQTHTEAVACFVAHHCCEYIA